MPKRIDPWIWIIGLGLICYLLFFEPKIALSVVPVQNWDADDGCYIQHLGNLLGIDGSSICRIGYGNYYARGIALLWLVPGVIGQWVGLIRGENVTDWVVAATGASSYLFWVFSFYFLMQTAFRKSTFSTQQIILFVFNVPVLYYAATRTHMVHGAEFFLVSLSYWLLMQERWKWFAVVSALLVLTRYNDVFIFGLALAAWTEKKSIRFQSFASILILAVLSFVVYLSFYWGYQTVTVFSLAASFQLRALLDFFISPQWGTLWTAPWWVFSFILGTVLLKRLSWQGRAAWFWMFTHVILCAAWGGNGSDFAYRYLIGSYIGALIVWLEVLQLKPYLMRPFKWITGLGAIWMTLMTILYRHVPGTQPMWNAQGGCDIPPKITLEIFRNIFNPEPYRLFFQTHFVPGILYRDWKEPFLTTPIRSVTWGMLILLILLMLSLVAAVIFERKIKKERSFSE